LRFEINYIFVSFVKKQIVYPDFIPRVFAMTIDIAILLYVWVFITPVLNIATHQVFVYIFQDFFLLYSIDMSDAKAVAATIYHPAFSEYVSAPKFLAYFGYLLFVNTVFLGSYFITFWYKFGATPGKMAMKMKIVDANDYSKPPLCNLVKRFFGYITALIGMWSILFSRRGIALHDKIANTVVIKS